MEFTVFLLSKTFKRNFSHYIIFGIRWRGWWREVGVGFFFFSAKVNMVQVSVFGYLGLLLYGGYGEEEGSPVPVSLDTRWVKWMTGTWCVFCLCTPVLSEGPPFCRYWILVQGLSCRGYKTHRIFSGPNSIQLFHLLYFSKVICHGNTSVFQRFRVLSQIGLSRNKCSYFWLTEPTF